MGVLGCAVMRQRGKSDNRYRYAWLVSVVSPACTVARRKRLPAFQTRSACGPFLRYPRAVSCSVLNTFPRPGRTLWITAQSSDHASHFMQPRGALAHSRHEVVGRLRAFDFSGTNHIRSSGMNARFVAGTAALTSFMAFYALVLGRCAAHVADSAGGTVRGAGRKINMCKADARCDTRRVSNQPPRLDRWMKG